jgi:hypothetical protein
MEGWVEGWKLVQSDGTSLNGRYRYVMDGATWETVPGAGAAVAITGGLLSGGDGSLLLRVECDPDSECYDPPIASKGVRWYRRIRTRRPTPAELARVAREDPDWEVRAAAVGRLTDPVELVRAARDRIWYVRAAAVGRLTDPVELVRAGRDRSWYVRAAAVRRLTDPVELARVAREDPDRYVRAVAVRRLRAQPVA